MSLRQAYAPLRPEFDDFLFATVGEEINGIPLSTISMLTQLGLDPWREAGRLAALAKREAAEQLAQIIARLPEMPWRDEERGEIAGHLIELLPQRVKSAGPVNAGSSSSWLNVPGQAKLWLIGLILGTAVLVGAVAQGGLLFGNRGAPGPQSTVDTPLRK